MVQLYILCTALAFIGACVAQLYSPNTLPEGSITYSPNRRYFVVLQEDGNLCVRYNFAAPYVAPLRSAIWCSMTVKSSGNFYLKMQTDGNLCVYDYSDPNFWWCPLRTAQPTKQYQMLMQDDGNLCVKDMAFNYVWCTMAVPEFSKFSMAMTSDSQYPWWDGGGADPNAPSPINGDSCPGYSYTNIKAQYTSIVNLRNWLGNPSNGHPPLKGVVMNGDLTAYGHGWQRDGHHQLRVDTLIKNGIVNTYLGLGNHDYSNNVGDTENNGAPTNMVRYMMEYVPQIYAEDYDAPVEREVSYKDGSKTIVKEIKGSMAYSWNMGPFHFIQLQLHPAYANQWDTWSSKYPVGYWRYLISDSYDWLENNLKKYANTFTIINLHQLEDGFSIANEPRFLSIIRKYKVAAVFSGHYHQEVGLKEYLGDTKIPHFKTGAASYFDYLLLELDAINPTFTVYQVTNDRCGNALFYSGNARSWACSPSGCNGSLNTRRVDSFQVGSCGWKCSV